jgi:hypothetical protein
MEARRRVLVPKRFGYIWKIIQWRPRKAGLSFPSENKLTLRLTLLQSKGMDRPSFVGTLINDAERYGLSDRENSWLAAMM